MVTLAALGGWATGLWAQGAAPPLVLEGRARRVYVTDTSALAGAVVVAHRIGVQEQGPVDSVTADRFGRFRFRIARPDTAAMYVVSTDYQGLGYFSVPVAGTGRPAVPELDLTVFDTSSSGLPLTVAQRHVVVSRTGTDGLRGVLDIYGVRNPGWTTRVPRDSTSLLWRAKLPSGISGFEVTEADFSREAVRQDGDGFGVLAPIPPGEKQVAVSYTLPGTRRSLRIPVDQPTDQLEVLAEDTAVGVRGAGLLDLGPVVMGERRFRRFSARRVPAGATVAISFSGRAGNEGAGGAERLLWIAVGAAAIGLAAGLFGLVRGSWRRGAAPATAAGGLEETDRLLAELAALDERYHDRQASTSATEWAAYQERRARLKARLAALLAREGSRSP